MKFLTTPVPQTAMQMTAGWLTVAVRCSEDIKFADTPTQLQFSIGSSALLECVVTGQPRPTVSWRFNRRKITPGKTTTLAACTPAWKQSIRCTCPRN